MEQITEYTITFKDSTQEDFITEDESEAQSEFDELDEALIHQYFAKDYVKINGDWEETDVEVFFSNIDFINHNRN